MTQLSTLAGDVDGVAAHAGVLRALGHGEPGPHAAFPRRSAHSRTTKTSCDGIYAPRRAGDVAGAVLVMGADVDLRPTSEPRGRLVHAVWATTSVIATLPLVSARTTSSLRSEVSTAATGRRPSQGPATLRAGVLLEA